VQRVINLEQVRTEELDLLFRVFDTDHDGFLQLGEVRE
jgi:Ca2+-binding EF-hand superfamily protein